MRQRPVLVLVVAAMGFAGLRCATGEGTDSAVTPPLSNDGGRAGSAGSAGQAGDAGHGGTAGTAGEAGSAGAAGVAGQAGEAGTGGSGGTAGTAGSAGSAGDAGAAGAAGSAGSGGTAGTAGSAGSAGSGGIGGMGGTAGSGGTGGTAGTAGSAGSAGSGGSAGAPICECSAGDAACLNQQTYQSCDDGCHWSYQLCATICQQQGYDYSTQCAYNSGAGKDVCHCANCQCTTSTPTTCADLDHINNCIDNCSWTPFSCDSICASNNLGFGAGCAAATGSTGDTCYCAPNNTMAFRIINECAGMQPYFALYDQSTPQLDGWGIFQATILNKPYFVVLDCDVGHQICFGAWYGNNYWGCGEDCAESYSPSNACFTCTHGDLIALGLECDKSGVRLINLGNTAEQTRSHASGTP